jgi:arsenical pump membrane protein
VRFVQGAAAEAVAAALLFLTLVAAVVRPRGIGESAVALPAAAVAVASGVVPFAAAVDVVERIGPTVGYLAAILALGELCSRAGVFSYLATFAMRHSRAEPRRLLLAVVVIAAIVTAVLTLDATVVLLTPVVLAAARSARLTARPFVVACVRLANSSSLLLPVSNLTNLLAFSACGLSFGRFTALMVLPWLLACLVEWSVLRAWFRRDLAGPAARMIDEPCPAPRYPLTVLAPTLAGFVLLPTFGLSPAWAAAAGCLALLADRRAAAGSSVAGLLRSARPGFCVFVLALAVVVEGLARHGLASGLRRVLPDGSAWVTILAVAFVAALLANVVNNLPATLMLVPILAGNPAALLAALLGVNIGPNAAYPGSLATLLWRRLVPRADRPSAAGFHRLGVLTVPASLIITATALWAAVRVIGT